MKKLISNLFTFLLLIISIILFGITLIFCLEVFEIVDIPEEFSIESLFYSKVEVLASGEDAFENTLVVDDVIKETKRKVIKNKKNEVNSSEIDESFWNELEKELQGKESIEFTENTTSNNFYYEQLDEYAKIIYDRMNANIDKLKTGTYTEDFGLTFNDLLHEEGGDQVLNNSFQLAINALTFDTPDLFYIDVTRLYLLTQITTRAFSKKYEVSIGPNKDVYESYLSDNFSTTESVDTAISKIENIKDDLVVQCDGKNTIEKIRIVQNYLIDTVDYDSNAGDNIYNVYGTLINKRSVCEGYARSFKYIMDKLEIPCIIACGIGKNSTGSAESHAWNYVQINGDWYAIDVTWNDPIMPDGAQMTDEIRYKYFLRGSDKFFGDHFEDGNIVGEANFKYPTLSVVDYK